MKKLGFGVAVCSICLTLASSSFAGPVVSKEYKAVEPPPCFGEHEFQADVFGAYGVTEEHQGGIMRDHGWGGGVGLNYFFTRWLGLGVDGTWLRTNQDVFTFDRQRIGDGEFRRGDLRGEDIEKTTREHNAWGANGSIILRYPIDRWCLAPYLFFGGGAQWTSSCYGSVHAGGGLEYRIVPQRFGVFVDGRFTALNDHNRPPIHNPHFTLVRAGFKFVF